MSEMTPFIEKSANARNGILSCLCMALLECGALCQTSGITAADFDGDGPLYTVLMDSWTRGEEFDFLRVLTRLTEAGALENVGGPVRLNGLCVLLPTASNLQYYLDLLLEARAARLLANLGERLRSAAFDATTDPQELLEEARESLGKIFVTQQTNKTSIGHFAAQIVEDLEEPERHQHAEVIQIGLGIDEGAGPFERGDLIVVAGRTKGGKSSLAGNLIEHCASAGRRCAMFSFEMTGKQNVSRMLASSSRVDLRDLRSRLNADKDLFSMDHSKEMFDLARIKTSAIAMKTWRVNIFERLKGIEQVTAEMARMKCSGGLDVAMIDYAQLVRGLRSKGESREREVASISYELKQAAMKHQCLVLLLSQLTVDERTGSAHLRESRALGQDANCILFIEGEGEEKVLRVEAARSAPSGTEIPLLWEEKFTKFSAR